MTAILADHNIVGQARLLLGTLTQKACEICTHGFTFSGLPHTGV